MDTDVALASVSPEGLGWQESIGLGVGVAALTSFAATEAYAARRREQDEQELIVSENAPRDVAFGGDDDAWLDEAEVLWGGNEFAASTVEAKRRSFESATDKIAKEIGELLLPGRARFG